MLVRFLLGSLSAGFVVANAYFGADALASAYGLSGIGNRVFTFVWLLLAFLIGSRVGIKPP